MMATRPPMVANQSHRGTFTRNPPEEVVRAASSGPRSLPSTRTKRTTTSRSTGDTGYPALTDGDRADDVTAGGILPSGALHCHGRATTTPAVGVDMVTAVRPGPGPREPAEALADLSVHCPTVAVMTSSTGRRTRAGRLRLPRSPCSARRSSPRDRRPARAGNGRARRHADPHGRGAGRGRRRPRRAGPVPLDTTLYLPATTPAPAVLVAHGFGGTKASVDADARALVDRGFVVLDLDGPRLRRQRRADRARLAGLRGRGRPRAGRPAGRAPRGGAGRSGRPAGGRHRRVVRRGARAAARRLRLRGSTRSRR